MFFGLYLTTIFTVGEFDDGFPWTPRKEVLTCETVYIV